VSGDDLTVSDLCNRFLTAKKRKLDAGEITARTFDECREMTARIIGAFGKDRLVDDLASDDFENLRSEMTTTWGPVRLAKGVGGVRSVFKYGHEAGLIDKPIRFGPGFVKPSASVLRRHKAKNGDRMIEADELRRLLDAAPVQLRAMLMLAINCGFGNHDCASIPLSALSLDDQWINYPRPKTGIERRCPLWPETVEALRAAIVERPEPRRDDAKDLVFVTTRGRPWLSGGIANPVSVAARDLMKSIGIHRKGIGFYLIRHTHRTISDGARDQVAANLIMGHSDPSMANVYRERIDDDRLRRVVEHVRAWLFPPDDTSGKDDQPRALSQNLGQMATDDNNHDVEPALRLFVG